MDEQFLHYIWKFQKFKSNQLELINNQSLKIFYPGNHNHDSGPDFEEARIKIDEIEWAGQVEIHINSSDWLHHNHQEDQTYESVVLHVVWNHDKEIHIQNEVIPTLELKNLVDPFLIEKYHRYISTTDEILCSSQINSLSNLTISSMLDRVLIERLSNKASEVLMTLSENTNDWEQVTYRTIAANFGFSTNKGTFIRLTELAPFEVLKKVLHNQLATEALLYGQSGFLDNTIDDYQTELNKEYQFLKKKFRLKEGLSKSYWKSGKLRPTNFPIVRIAQLSALLHSQPQLFTLLIKTININELKQRLMVDVSTYWQLHYDFNKRTKKTNNSIGRSSFENLLINSVSPLLAAYARFTDEHQYMDRAINLLESISPERNRITKKWDPLEIKAKSAFDSQALIQLHKNYCEKRRCLKCNIGVEILNE